MSNFPFVKNKILKQNLDITFDHIIDLIAITDSYEDIRASSFRKTIILYTATIIEALLLYLLKQNTKEDKIETGDWKYGNPKLIHALSDSPKEDIVWCIRKKEIIGLHNLDLFKISRVCLNNSLITQELFNDVNKVRKMRNKLHLGSLESLETEYSLKDLKFVFEIAKKVKHLASQDKLH